VVEFRADQSLTLAAHDAHWGGRPPLRQVRFVEVPEVASRINGLLAGDFHFACDVPPDQIPGIERNRAFEVQGGTIPNHRLICFDRNHAALRDPRVYRPRLVRHRAVAYAARAAVESWSCRTALGGLNPWRSISQVEL
jgi:peptide/nickel transport system substrate-binding protein